MKRNIIVSILVGMLMMLSGCGNDYIEPKTATISTLGVYEDVHLDNGSGLDTRITIDGASIEPNKTVKLLPGEHQIAMDISSFDSGNREYAPLQEISLLVKPKSTYIIEIEEENTIEHDVVKYSVFENKKLLSKKIIDLQPSHEYAPSTNEIVQEAVLQSVIDTVIMTALL